jgi:hypothetical protein
MLIQRKIIFQFYFTACKSRVYRNKNVYLEDVMFRKSKHLWMYTVEQKKNKQNRENMSTFRIYIEV